MLLQQLTTAGPIYWSLCTEDCESELVLLSPPPTTTVSMPSSKALKRAALWLMWNTVAVVY